MSDFERMKQAYLEIVMRAEEKLCSFSPANKDKFAELTSIEPKNEEELKNVSATLDFMIDMVDITDDIQNNKIDDDEFYKNKGNKYIIKYINAAKEGKDTREVLEDLLDPKEKAEVLYGLIKSTGSIDKSSIYIRLKTGFDYDEENDFKIEDEFMEYYLDAYNKIYNHTMIDTISESDKNSFDFYSTFHILYRGEKFLIELSESILNTSKEIKSEASEMIESLKKLDEKRQIEKENDILKVYNNSYFAEHKEELEEKGFVFENTKYDDLYSIKLPEGWSLGGMDDRLQNTILDNNGNVIGNLTYYYRNGSLEYTRMLLKPCLKVSNDDFLKKNRDELEDMGFNFIGIPNNEEIAIDEFPEGWSVEKAENGSGIIILDENGFVRGNIVNNAMKINRYYDIHLEEKNVNFKASNAIRVKGYFGNENEKLHAFNYIKHVDNCFDDKDCYDKIASWANKHYPDWRKLDSYWPKETNKEYIK